MWGALTGLGTFLAKMIALGISGAMFGLGLHLCVVPIDGNPILGGILLVSAVRGYLYSDDYYRDVR